MPASNTSKNEVCASAFTALLPQSLTTASAATVVAAGAVGTAVMLHMHRKKLRKRASSSSASAPGTRRERDEVEARSLVGSAPEMVPVSTVANGDDDGESSSTSAPSALRPARMLTTLTRALGEDGVVSKDGPSESSSKGRRPQRPTAVLIHGFGCTCLEWTDVTRSLTERGIADVFAYERILFVEEGDAPLPERNVVNLVEELRTILRLRGVPPPYLLVGHSYGGLVAQCFAMSHVDLVAGMVLIDPAHETQFQNFPSDFALSFKIVPYLFSAYRRLAWTGVLRVMDFCNLFNFPPLFLLPWDSPHRRAALDLYSDGPVWGRVSDELDGCNSSFDSIMTRFRVERRGTVGNARVPCALVIAADRRYSPTLNPHSVTRAFLDMHREFVEETCADVIMAEGSDHWVHVQRPDLIVDAVRGVLRRIEEGKGDLMDDES